MTISVTGENLGDCASRLGLDRNVGWITISPNPGLAYGRKGSLGFTVSWSKGI